MTSALTNSLLKASLQRLTAELEFLHTNEMISDESHAKIHRSLAATRDKLKVGKYVAICTFTHEKKGAAELQVDKGQVLEVLDDKNKDWYMGRVRGGDGVIGWAPKNRFRLGDQADDSWVGFDAIGDERSVVPNMHPVKVCCSSE
ncbi:hypothetical protein FN846DRAFT_887947 [Sphaerosporella brunnea]|uniref:SH3 domain-containing protein n=1 Tax=Sphaerosporella brunnea TaxID=1250544 RepID=A0A5J5F4I7_9PEZI|nr:hypothetical protein FN846DRAFT_887947 [Sphaerosporella brunnea]